MKRNLEIKNSQHHMYSLDIQMYEGVKKRQRDTGGRSKTQGAIPRELASCSSSCKGHALQGSA